ncbi:MAG: histidine kinase [Bacteroidetes bacterium]|nr:histidine kinase [Bacteroidota bacterium]
MSVPNSVFTLNNPIVFSILMVLAILGVIYIFYVHIIIPLNKKYSVEKENLELKNAQLMALFAELDPEPVFRFNGEGNFILANKAGKKLCNLENIEGESVISIFPAFNYLNFNEYIVNGLTTQSSIIIGEEFFDVIIKGISEMQFGQIYFNNITQRKLVEDELKKYQIKLRELSNKIQRMQEEENQKISRELHDNLGQILTIIKLNIEILKEDGNSNTNKGNIINEISLMLDKAMTEVKELSYKLKPRILDDFGLIPSLKSLCNDVSRKSGIKGIFQSHKLDFRLSPEIELGLFRISQEALNNIVKHSRAKEFSIQIVKHPTLLRLMVEDDGIGFDPQIVHNDPAKKNNLGLVNMSERALSLNGKLIFDSRIGGGTEIIVEIPLENFKPFIDNQIDNQVDKE